ncbi:MAG: sugar phosphate isomerase/epimerase [Firmicutes bacterium]|nr:sugar phosphate isomerase/epimerase [Bacillota bacterium]
MKVGVFNPVLYHMNFADAVKYLASQNVSMIELGCGGYPGTKHADAKVLAGGGKALDEIKAVLKDNGVAVSALSVHGNPVSPDPAFTKSCRDDFIAACKLANKLGTDRVVTFSGCPGDGKGDKPNWVTCSWPSEFSEMLKYQWEDVLIPYWQEAALIARDNGVKHICLEMHPGFCVYNPGTLMRLRAAVGEAICVNFDPSHLIWQGIDPAEAIRYLGAAIQHFHAKDTEIYPHNRAVQGVLDTGSMGKAAERSWLFRTVGYGLPEIDWKRMVSALKIVGYDYVLSVEHEDLLMSSQEGLEKAIGFLQRIVIEQSAAAAWWV